MHGNVIASISTPPGKGGVAVIRISGEGALEVAARVFAPLSGKSITDYPARMQIYGYIISDGERIDDGMLTVFRAPSSYTGEDTAEISCHGGVLVTRTVLEAVFKAGAVPAMAGEFTQRAFINGKLSLSEAEAIGCLLEAQSREQIRLASLPSRAKLNEAVGAVRAELTDIMSSVYARIDYPDEDLGELSDTEVQERLVDTLARLDTLIATYRTGRAISEGIDTVIIGKPNVGKSTLYNLIVGEDAAIVTDTAGTTRDVLERTVALGRVTLRLSDTAGVRGHGASDEAERIGISRSRDRLSRAELIIAVFDGTSALDADDMMLIEELNNAHGCLICLVNKCDTKEKSTALPGGLEDLGADIIYISARDRGAEAVAELTAKIDSLFTDGSISTGHDAIVSSARQHASLLRTRELISSAIEAYRIGLAQDAASSDIEKALGALGELDGRAVSEAVVSDIFAKFCVGK